MGEHLLCTQEVIGSIPFTSTTSFSEGGKEKGRRERAFRSTSWKVIPDLIGIHLH